MPRTSPTDRSPSHLAAVASAREREVQELRQWQQRAMTLFVRIDRDWRDNDAMSKHRAAGQAMVDEGLRRFSPCAQEPEQAR